MNACPRSGYLYALHKGEAQTADMVRGSAIHAVSRAPRNSPSTRARRHPRRPREGAVDEVLAEMPVPIEQHDFVRECVWRWASETAFFRPADVIAVERLIVMQLEGFEVRMKVDYAALLEDGAAVHVVDYKSSRSMPQQEEVARGVRRTGR
jgi:hypothetical protein